MQVNNNQILSVEDNDDLQGVRMWPFSHSIVIAKIIEHINTSLLIKTTQSEILREIDALRSS